MTCIFFALCSAAVPGIHMYTYNNTWHIHIVNIRVWICPKHCHRQPGPLRGSPGSTPGALRESSGPPWRVAPRPGRLLIVIILTGSLDCKWIASRVNGLRPGLSKSTERWSRMYPGCPLMATCMSVWYQRANPSASERAPFSLTSRITSSEKTPFCRYCPAYLWDYFLQIPGSALHTVVVAVPHLYFPEHIPVHVYTRRMNELVFNFSCRCPAYVWNYFIEILHYDIPGKLLDSDTKVHRVRSYGL